MKKSNQPGRGLHHGATAGFTESDDDLASHPMGDDHGSLNHVGRHRQLDDASAATATAMKAKSKTHTTTSTDGTANRQSKQGNRPDAR